MRSRLLAPSSTSRLGGGGLDWTENGDWGMRAEAEDVEHRVKTS